MRSCTGSTRDGNLAADHEDAFEGLLSRPPASLDPRPGRAERDLVQQNR